MTMPFIELMPLSVSAFEWGIMNFQLEDNNVSVMGGLGPSGVSVQMNVSSSFHELVIKITEYIKSSGADLSNSIGRPQGKSHPDGDDALTIDTLFTVLFRLPPGELSSGILLGKNMRSEH
ncbi:hypothetical protein AAF712_001535 [Marasmius tenuissimus]|uniref:Uncharacterized protein n=1 Tax=Marasmius tenuissimus TaxID=585030 RepID=A0ABR3ADM4_9AGAR